MRKETGINEMLKQQLSPKKTAIVQNLAGLSVEHFLAGKRRQMIVARE
jgi:hypothetical protein